MRVLRFCSFVRLVLSWAVNSFVFHFLGRKKPGWNMYASSIPGEMRRKRKFKTNWVLFCLGHWDYRIQDFGRRDGIEGTGLGDL